MSIIISRLILNLRHLSTAEGIANHNKDILTPPNADPETVAPQSLPRSWFSTVVFRHTNAAQTHTQGSQLLSIQESAQENGIIPETHRAHDECNHIGEMA